MRKITVYLVSTLGVFALLNSTPAELAFARDQRGAPNRSLAKDNSEATPVLEAPAEHAQPHSPEMKIKVKKLNAAAKVAGRKIVDITKAVNPRKITTDMAKFYLAVGMMNAWECYSTQDPTVCNDYTNSLKDPISNIGFVFFMLASHGTSSMILKVAPKKPMLASYSGLVVGMMAQDLFQEIWKSENFKKYQKTWHEPPGPKRDQDRNDALNALWHESVADPNWWLNKVPDIAGMIGGAFISSLKYPLIQGVSKAADNVIIHVFRDGKQSKAILKVLGDVKSAGATFGNKYIAANNGQRDAKMISGTYKATSVGMRLIWAETGELVAVAPMFAIGATIVETIIFLDISNHVTEQVRGVWDEGRGLIKLNQREADFQAALGNQKLSNQDLRTRAEALHSAWSDFRGTMLIKPEAIHQRHANEFEAFSAQKDDLYAAIDWATSKHLDRKKKDHIASDENVENYWEQDSNADSFIENLFCGPRPKQAVQTAKAVLGVPVPFLGEDKIKPFRIKANVEAKYCDEFSVKQLDEKSWKELIAQDCKGHLVACEMYEFDLQKEAPQDFGWNRRWLSHQRRLALATQDFTKEVNEAKAELDLATDPIFTQMIERYDRVLQQNLLEALNGTTVSLPAGKPVEYGKELRMIPMFGRDFQAGVLPNFDAESAYWSDVATKNTNRSDVVKLANEEKDALAKNKAAAQALQKYSELPYQKRTLPKDVADTLKKEMAQSEASSQAAAAKGAPFGSFIIDKNPSITSDCITNFPGAGIDRACKN